MRGGICGVSATIVPLITRPVIVAAALALLDERGLARVTFRRLAKRLDSTEPHLRGQFASRSHLLNAMADAMMGAAHEQPLMERDWRERLQARASASYQAMASRRDGAVLFAQTRVRMRTGFDGCVAALAADGFAESAAEIAVDLVDSFTLGWASSHNIAFPLDPAIDERLALQIEIILSGIDQAHPRTANVSEQSSSGGALI